MHMLSLSIVADSYRQLNYCGRQVVDRESTDLVYRQVNIYMYLSTAEHSKAVDRRSTAASTETKVYLSLSTVDT